MMENIKAVNPDALKSVDKNIERFPMPIKLEDLENYCTEAEINNLLQGLISSSLEYVNDIYALQQEIKIQHDLDDRVEMENKDRKRSITHNSIHAQIDGIIRNLNKFNKDEDGNLLNKIDMSWVNKVRGGNNGDRAISGRFALSLAYAVVARAMNIVDKRVSENDLSTGHL